LFGEGLGSKIYTVTIVKGIWGKQETHFIHSNYAELMLRGGLTGLVIFFSFLLGYMRICFRTLKQLRYSIDPARKNLAFIGLSVLFSMMAVGFLNISFNHYMLPSILMAAAVCGYRSLLRQQHTLLPK
jgi:hypothetical protein